jgi:thioesterase domain-containing protein
VTGKPSPPTIDVLTQIWQRVLARSPIGPDDNFFDLGGNDGLADEVFARIAQVSGRELPSARIYQAPTIRALTALLEQPALPQFSPFVQLKAGSAKPPILIAPGVGGRASFSELAKHIRTKHAIYGIQAKGVDGMEEPFESIEDMAQFYLDALSELEPDGPYILIGYSLGGLVALEMAQRLSKAGQNVALLVLLDTYPHPRYLPLCQLLWLLPKRVGGQISDIKKMPIGDAFLYLVRRLGRGWHIDRAQRRMPPPGTSGLSFAATTLRVKESDFVALARYRPRFYRGKIRFVRPEANPYLPNDPTAVWTKLADALEVETVPGDHLGMVGTHFESLAAVLTRYVEEAVEKTMSQP